MACFNSYTHREKLQFLLCFENNKISKNLIIYLLISFFKFANADTRWNSYNQTQRTVNNKRNYKCYDSCTTVVRIFFLNVQRFCPKHYTVLTLFLCVILNTQLYIYTCISLRTTTIRLTLCIISTTMTIFDTILW